MNAPTFQAEGTVAASATATPPAVTIPTHAANDILIANVAAWVPQPVASVDQIPTPSGWTLIGTQVQSPAGTADGWLAQFYKRATGAGTTITLTAGANWTSDGTTSCIAARVDVIRGCVTTGTPYESLVTSALDDGVDPDVDLPAITVAGDQRLAVYWGIAQDNVTVMGGTAITNAGFTQNTQTNTATGSDAGFRVAYKSSNAATLGPYTATASTFAQGAYIYRGMAFLPTPDSTVYHADRSQYLNRRRRRL